MASAQILKRLRPEVTPNRATGKPEGDQGIRRRRRWRATVFVGGPGALPNEAEIVQIDHMRYFNSFE
ncbi:hypothetical protein DF3PA_380006 [Candidatus Defluviicoccus seviourii]|uniref:Uncharacterized protein n=2 Tax=root TaxID=1 RepID=A0A564WFN8_9PROT|nr:hypothetical protein DF3PB_2480002 [uncultured Defluviicoccus sp.]VUX47111.1 hypothetical protein DF3PA_380006 [Candidatus Defluviicoccus seviourii]